jgi:hypothetical protein
MAKFLWNLYGLGEYAKICIYITKKGLLKFQQVNVTIPIHSYCFH